MLTLKLLLVPAFLLLLSLAGKRWGPSVAGWLAGLPVIAGPILFFLAVEQGVAFASSSAAASLSAVFASVAFSLAYSHSAQRTRWALALLIALLAWFAGVFVLALLPTSPMLSLLVAMLALFIAPSLYPAPRSQLGAHAVSSTELCWRMAAGATLTVIVTATASSVGSAWSGLFAVFPVLGIVLAVFSHRTHGSAYVAALLRAMNTGLYSFAAFCLALSVALPRIGITAAFLVAATLAVAVQAATGMHLTFRSRRRPTAAPEL